MNRLFSKNQAFIKCLLVLFLTLAPASRAVSTQTNYVVYLPLARPSLPTYACVDRVLAGRYLCIWHLSETHVKRDATIQVFGRATHINFGPGDQYIPSVDYTMNVRGVVFTDENNSKTLDGILCTAKTNLDGVATCSVIVSNLPKDASKFEIYIILGGLSKYFSIIIDS